MNSNLGAAGIAVGLFVVVSGAGAAQAWTRTATTGADNYLIGATGTGAGSTLKICDPTTGNYLSWSSPPANPLSANGTFEMKEGDDFLRIVTNDGWWPCGYMYRVIYNGWSLTLVGDDGSDTLIGGSGADVIMGDSPSIATCYAATTGGNDYLASGGGTDYVYGCGGDDTFDTYYGSAASTVVYGGDGADCIEAISGMTVWCHDDTPDGILDGDEDKYDDDASAEHCDPGVGHEDVIDSSLSCP